MSRRRLPTARKCLPYRVRCKLKNLAAVILGLFLLTVVFLVLFPRAFQYGGQSETSESLKTVLTLQSLNISALDIGSKTHCRFHACFDINQCILSLREDILGVHVHGQYDFYDPFSSVSLSVNVSKEYTELLQAMKTSRYYVSTPASACVFIPPIDTLAQQSLDLNLTSTILNTLPGWEDGQNWLIFSMLPGQPPHFNTTPDFYYGKAMVAGASFSPASYRSGFDVNIPIFNPLTKSEKLFKMAATSKRPRLLTIITHGNFKDLEEVRKVVRESKGTIEMAISPCPHVKPDKLPTRRCGFKDKETHPFPELLLHSRFCLLTTGGSRIALPDFTDMLMTGCIPVIVSDILLPFSEVLDWNTAATKCLGCGLEDVLSKLRHVPVAMLDAWRKQVLYLYNRYFSSMTAITMATLDILNDRVFPLSGRSADWWNKGYDVSQVAKELGSIHTKHEEGFTTVILTYNRVQSLFEVIKSVARAPSCVKIMVIWNNVEVAPPPVKEWPRVRQKIEIVRSKENKLSNRFYPYANLTTAVFSLDDDITMLTVDELEFGYKAWQEYPNRLVGFPSRIHLKNTDSSGKQWRYESDWLNNISMVLTGAAFYHKYYHYLYTYVMPREVREWVDSHMNCEDIAMNYLVSNYTGLPPLKISARKKFVCPSCPAEDSLWNELDHYKERTDCINLFAKLFGQMPLKAVKFRVDPVLYKKEGIDREAMAYPNIGEL